jgi:hypothetical protein
MKKVFLCLALGAMWLCSVSMQAGVLLPATSPDPNFIAVVDIPTGNITINLTVPEQLSVLDDSSTFLGSVLAQSLSSSTALTLDLPGASELVSLTFAGNLGTPGVSISGNNLFIPVIGSPLTGLIQPQMLALIGNSTFAFQLASLTDTTGTFDFFVGQLPPSATTPEPAVAYTVGLGILALSALRLRKRAR